MLQCGQNARMDTSKREIAAAAARLVVEEGMEYGPAKRRALRDMGLSARTALPHNDDVEAEVRDQRLGIADQHVGRISGRIVRRRARPVRAQVWHDDVFVLEQGGTAWKAAGKLPRPLGYGVSLSTKGGVICIGGSDAQRHYADAFWLRWENGALQFAALPALPPECRVRASHPPSATRGKAGRLLPPEMQPKQHLPPIRCVIRDRPSTR